MATAGKVPIVLVAENLGQVNSADQIATAFTQEMQNRPEVTPELAFQIFAEYGGRLKALMKDLPAEQQDQMVNDLLKAGERSPAAGYASSDMDHDTVKDLKEAAMARNPHHFDVRDEEVGKVWTTTYWPMAGGWTNRGLWFSLVGQRRAFGQAGHIVNCAWTRRHGESFRV